MASETLTIIDNRTGKKYEIPIRNGAIKATDLFQIKVAEDDGLVSYDPGFMNTASCQSKITYIDGDKGILRYRGYPIEQIAEKSNYLRNRLFDSSRRAADRSLNWPTGRTTLRITRSSMKTSRSSSTGFIMTPTRWEFWSVPLEPYRLFIPEPKKSSIRSPAREQTYRLISKMPTLAGLRLSS